MVSPIKPSFWQSDVAGRVGPIGVVDGWPDVVGAAFVVVRTVVVDVIVVRWGAEVVVVVVDSFVCVLCPLLSISLKLLEPPPHSSRFESWGCTHTLKSDENTVPGPHENSYACNFGLPWSTQR